jgi:hypothetical protein
MGHNVTDTDSDQMMSMDRFQQKKEVEGSLALWNISKKKTATTASSKASRLGLIDDNRSMQMGV